MLGFMALFSNLKVVKRNMSGDLIEYKVPVHYANKSKTLQWKTDVPSSTNTLLYVNYGIMVSYELAGMSPARERNINPIHQFKTGTAPTKYKYSRSPYDFEFMLTIKANTADDALSIFEQIAPYFNPTVNVTLVDDEVFGEQDLQITLNSVSPMFENDGDLTGTRSTEIAMSFTAKGYLYQMTKAGQVIKKVVVNVSDQNRNTLYTTAAEVNPRSADQDDPHTIVITETEL